MWICFAWIGVGFIKGYSKEADKAPDAVVKATGLGSKHFNKISLIRVGVKSEAKFCKNPIIINLKDQKLDSATMGPDKVS